MYKPKKEEIPLVNIERNPLVLLLSLALTVGLVYLTFRTLFDREVSDINPLGFFLFVPTSIVLFQTLWYLLNPFAIIFEDKVEIKLSLFHNKFWFYNDLKKVSELKNGKIAIYYNDNEIEKLNLLGIKSTHKSLLREELNKQIANSLLKRD